MSSKPPSPETVLLTGFPSYLASRVGRRILETRPGARIFLLHSGADAPALRQMLAKLGSEQRSRLLPLEGDVSFMDLGLTSELYGRLVQEVTEVQHLASRYVDRGSAGLLRRVNITGTREILELAGQCQRLRRLVHWSTVGVSGMREGVVLEEELECGQRFYSPWQQTRYEAERLVRRAARKLPVTVLRAGVVVGDSDTGELGPYEGPHDLVLNLVRARTEQPAVLPGGGNAPVHLVPVDFVVAAGCHLSEDPSAEGKTFHLVDPSPLPAKSVYRLIARRAHRQPLPRTLPRPLRDLLRLSERVRGLSQGSLLPAELFDSMVFYNCKNTLTHLAGTALHCPPLESYVERLVRYINIQDEHRRSREDEMPADPLA